MSSAERIVHKAVACVVRDFAGRRELLVFDHPLAGTQIPKGTMEAGEGVVEAALRELHEESGIASATPVSVIGTWIRRIGAGPHEDGPDEMHHWHLVLIRPDSELPDAWSHVAHGSPEEDGLVFRYRWVAVDRELPRALHPLFADVAQMLL
ncbi:MAG: NUDIX domain-containing protein [Planctomycetes bacterium]|nr:NUDIX domain-containing protein [Planctomycetota bacterium]